MHHIDDRYLRPQKAQWLRRMYNTPFPLREDLKVWRGDRATILPLREIPGEGVLFGRGGVCVIRRLLCSGKNVNAGAYRPNGFAEPEAVWQNSVRSALHCNISFRK